MTNDFNIRIGATLSADQKKIQNELNNQIKNAKVKAAVDININSKQLESEVKKLRNEMSGKLGIEIDNKTALKSIQYTQKAYTDLRKEIYQSAGQKPQILQDMAKYYTELEQKANKTAQSVQKSFTEIRKEAYQSIGSKSPELSSMSDYYSNLEKQSSSFYSKNKSAIDVEIQKREEESKIFSNQIKAQMEERIAAENKIQAELKQTAKSQQDTLNLSSGKIRLDNNITAYIKNNTNLSKDLVLELENVKTKIGSVDDSSSLKQLGNEFRTVTSKAEALGQTGNTVFTKLQKNALQFLNYLGSATIVMGSVRALQNLVSTVSDLDKSLVDLQMATGDTHEQAKELLNTYIDMGQQMGATGTEVAAAASDYLRQGKSIAETNELIKDSLVLAKIGNIDTADATTYLTTAMKGYKVEVSDVIGIVDKLSAVDLISATSAGGLATAMAQTATNANMAGVSMDKLLGYLAVVGETTGEAMSSVGNSFSTMFSRMANIKLKSLSDPEAASDLNNVETSLHNVGIALRSDNKTFRDFDDVLDDVAGKWNTFSEVNQRAIAVSIAGKDHMEDFLVLMSNYGKALEYTATAQNSSGTAMDKFGNYEESVEAKTKKLTSSLQELASDTLDSGLVKGFLDLANAFIQVTDKIGIFNIALLAISGVLGGKGILMIQPLAEWIGKLILPMLGASEAAGVLAGTLGAALSIIAPVGAIVGAIALYKHFNVTLEETQAKLAKQKEVYDNETSKVQSLTTELETAKSKLEELNKVGGAVVTKDGEKEKLQAQTEELQRQLDIAKETQRIKGLEAEQTATKTLGQTINSNYNAQEIHSDLFGYSVKYDKVTRDVELGRTMEDYNNLSASYTDLEKKQQTLAKSEKGNTKEFKNNAKELSNLSEKMQDARKHANELATKMQTESESLKGATTEGNAMKKTIDNSLKSYNSWTNSISEANSSLGETGTVSDKANNGIESNAIAAQEAATKLQQTNDTIDDYQKKMGEIKNALSDVDKLSTSDIMDFMQQYPTFDWGKYGVTGAAGVGDLTGAFKALGVEQYDTIAQSLGARDSFKALYDETVNVTDAVDTYGNTLNSAIGSISKFNSSLSSMDSAYASLSQKQSVSVEDIAALSETFGNISGFDNFINTISSAKSMTSDVQNAFNSLVGTYIETSGVLNDLDDSNKDLIITQLQHIGITNAEEIVTKQLAQQKAILAETGVDVKNATADEIIELIKEGNVSEDTKIALANLAAQKLNVNNIALSTSGDIQNLISLMSLTNATTEALQALQAAKAGDVPMSVSKPGDMQSMISRAQNEVDAYYKGLGNYQNVKYSGGDKTKSAADKQKKANDKTKKDFSQVFDWIEIRIDKLKEKAQKAIDDISKYIYYESQNNHLKVAIDTQIDEKKSLKSLMKSYNKMADKVKLPNKYQDLVNNGGFNVQTIKNEALAKKIEEYQKWKEAAAGVADEIKQINDKIKELNAQKLTNITEYFGDRNDYISAKISRKESEVSLKTDSGKSPTKHDYKALIKLQNDDKKNSQKELAAYTKQFNEQVKNGDITKNSPEYLKGLSEINDLTKAINESQSAVYNYKKEIRELDWKGFDKGITKVNNIKNELSDLSDMIRDSEILDDKGNYTEAGLTKLGLLSQQMNTNTKLASEYGKAIKKIGNELKNGTITQEQYNEELANYQSQQRQAIKDNQALEDSIAEIAKQRIQFEIDAINKETDAFKDLIDAKKEALQAEKDLHDYQESINKKQQSINTLQKQIAALKLSTDRKDISQRLKLEKDLKDQQADLDEEQYQHSVETQSDALDDEYDAYKKTQDEKVTALEKSLEDQKALVKSALDEVYANTTEISSGIQTLASEHGLTVSESVVSPWENAITAIEAYKTALASLPVSNELGGAISGAGIGAGIGSSSNGVSGSSSNGTSSQKSTKDSSSSKNTTTNSSSKLPISMVKYNGNKSSLNKDSSVVDRLKYYDLDSSSSSRSKLYKYFGLSGSYTGTDSQNAKLIAAMKKAGFSQGGTGKLVNSLEDEGFTLMKRDEAMLSSEQTEQFKQLLGYAPMIKPAIDSITGNSTYPNIQNNSPVNIHYDNLINIEGNADLSNIKQLELIAQKAVEKGNQTLISLLNQKH